MSSSLSSSYFHMYDVRIAYCYNKFYLNFNLFIVLEIVCHTTHSFLARVLARVLASAPSSLEIFKDCLFNGVRDRTHSPQAEDQGKRKSQWQIEKEKEKKNTTRKNHFLRTMTRDDGGGGGGVDAHYFILSPYFQLHVWLKFVFGSIWIPSKIE